MTKRDWFRSSTWNEADRKEFFVRLKRARPFMRSWYVRIQALHLKESGLALPALELLDLMLTEYPDRIQLAMAQSQKAQCLEELGRLDEAETAYLDSLETERLVPNVKTTTWLDFGWFVALHDRRRSFVDAIRVLDANPSDGISFPALRYRENAIRAVILHALGRQVEARRHALIALNAAAATHSGLRYHPTIGLVSKPEGRIHQLLTELAG